VRSQGRRPAKEKPVIEDECAECALGYLAGTLLGEYFQCMSCNQHRPADLFRMTDSDCTEHECSSCSKLGLNPVCDFCVTELGYMCKACVGALDSLCMNCGIKIPHKCRDGRCMSGHTYCCYCSATCIFTTCAGDACLACLGNEMYVAMKDCPISKQASPSRCCECSSPIYYHTPDESCVSCHLGSNSREEGYGVCYLCENYKHTFQNMPDMPLEDCAGCGKQPVFICERVCDDCYPFLIGSVMLEERLCLRCLKKPQNVVHCLNCGCLYNWQKWMPKKFCPACIPSSVAYNKDDKPVRDLSYFRNKKDWKYMVDVHYREQRAMECANEYCENTLRHFGPGGSGEALCVRCAYEGEQLSMA
jgi:hypothetical protein